MRSNIVNVERFSAAVESARAGDERSIRFLRDYHNTPEPMMPDKLVIMFSDTLLEYVRSEFGGRFAPRKKKPRKPKKKTK